MGEDEIDHGGTDPALLGSALKVVSRVHVSLLVSLELTLLVRFGLVNRVEKDLFAAASPTAPRIRPGPAPCLTAGPAQGAGGAAQRCAWSGPTQLHASQRQIVLR